MAKEDATGQAVESSMEQLQDINRKQSEIISAQARTIEELRGTIVELNASLAWLKRKVFGKMSEKCKPVDNGDPKLPFDYGDLERIEAEIEEARSRAAEQITVPKSRAANKTPRRNRVVMDNLPVVTFPEYRSSDWSAVKHHCSPSRTAAYFAIKYQNEVYQTVVSPSVPGLAAIYQPFITSCNQPLSNSRVKCVLPISAGPCRTTQRSFSWSFLNSSSEAAIFSAIVAILPFLFRS